MPNKYLLSYFPRAKIQSQKNNLQIKSKYVWSGFEDAWTLEDIGTLPVREVARFSPSTIRTGSLSRNEAYLHLRSSIRGFCTCCSWNKFRKAQKHSEIKSHGSWNTHTHTHIDIWVEISTSRVFSPNRCSPRRSSEGVPIPVPHCPTDTNRTLIQQGHSLGSALDLSLTADTETKALYLWSPAATLSYSHKWFILQWLHLRSLFCCKFFRSFFSHIWRNNTELL